MVIESHIYILLNTDFFTGHIKLGEKLLMMSLGSTILKKAHSSGVILYI